MYTLISGSPKPIGSNSLYFLKKISSNIENYKIHELKNKKYDEILNDIKNSDTIVLAFPLYVDCPTSIMLDFFDYIFDKKIELGNKIIYVVVNCGFREGEQNITAINVVKRWCDRVGAKYYGSIMIGAGEVVGKKKFQFISKTALKKLNEFSMCVRGREKIDDIITTMDLLNNKWYCHVANLSWSKSCKKNKLTDSDVRVK